MFKEGQLADFPEKHVELTVNDEGQIYLAGLLKDLGLSASAGQARRDIDGGGVKINGGLFGYDDPLGTEGSFGGAVKRKGC